MGWEIFDDIGDTLSEAGDAISETSGEIFDKTKEVGELIAPKVGQIAGEFGKAVSKTIENIEAPEVVQIIGKKLEGPSPKK